MNYNPFVAVVAKVNTAVCSSVNDTVLEAAIGKELSNLHNDELTPTDRHNSMAMLKNLSDVRTTRQSRKNNDKFRTVAGVIVIISILRFEKTDAVTTKSFDIAKRILGL